MSRNVFSCPCTTSHVSPLGFPPSFIHHLPSAGVRLLDGTITAWYRRGTAEHEASSIQLLHRGLGFALWDHVTWWCPPSESETHTLTTYMWVVCVCVRVRHTEQHVMKARNQPHPQREQKSKQEQPRIAPSITQRQAHSWSQQPAAPRKWSHKLNFRSTTRRTLTVRHLTIFLAFL